MNLNSAIRLQSGALPFRIGKGGKSEVLLVTTGRRGRWGIPKGKTEPYLTFDQNAAKEAFEEAGVIGKVSRNSSGKFRTSKRRGDTERVLEVWVYLLAVERIADDWPEKARRRIKWVRAKVAAKILREPFLSDLCRKLARAKSTEDALDFTLIPRR
jgi:8-oxo-dGTP pyrophosphatase MutT (NUDIX family)